MGILRGRPIEIGDVGGSVDVKFVVGFRQRRHGVGDWGHRRHEVRERSSAADIVWCVSGTVWGLRESGVGSF